MPDPITRKSTRFGGAASAPRASASRASRSISRSTSVAMTARTAVSRRAADRSFDARVRARGIGAPRIDLVAAA
jgi:hypothetical protein